MPRSALDSRSWSTPPLVSALPFDIRMCPRPRLGTPVIRQFRWLSYIGSDGFMYEAHFGLCAPPFQLSPDPSFYFDSKGHSNALAYLRFKLSGRRLHRCNGDPAQARRRWFVHCFPQLNTDRSRRPDRQHPAGSRRPAALDPGSIRPEFDGDYAKAQLIASLEAFLTPACHARPAGATHCRRTHRT